MCFSSFFYIFFTRFNPKHKSQNVNIWVSKNKDEKGALFVCPFQCLGCREIKINHSPCPICHFSMQTGKYPDKEEWNGLNVTIQSFNVQIGKYPNRKSEMRCFKCHSQILVCKQGFPKRGMGWFLCPIHVLNVQTLKEKIKMGERKQQVKFPLTLKDQNTQAVRNR